MKKIEHYLLGTGSLGAHSPETALSSKIVLALVITLASISGSIDAAELEVDPKESVFAVVTHKAGAAARLAHNHLVVARDYSVHLDYGPVQDGPVQDDSEQPTKAEFRLVAPATSLEIDSPQEQSRWFPRLQELGILEKPFGEMSSKNRSKVRSAMLGSKQLDAENFPNIEIELLEITPISNSEATARSDQADPVRESFDHEAVVRFEIHGQQRESPIRLRTWKEGNQIGFEAFGTLKLSSFGIEPYSALLGAVRNQDQVHIYLYLEASPISSKP